MDSEYDSELRDAFGNDADFYVMTDPYSNVQTPPYFSVFPIFLTGILNHFTEIRSGKAQIKIIRFVHPMDNGSGDAGHSYALLYHEPFSMGASAWLLFYEVGRKLSGSGGGGGYVYRNELLIRELLTNNKSRIQFRELEVPFEDLKGFVRFRIPKEPIAE